MHLCSWPHCNRRTINSFMVMMMMMCDVQSSQNGDDKRTMQLLQLSSCAACSTTATIFSRPCKWWLEQSPRAAWWPWLLTFEVIAHVPCHRTASPYQVWSSSVSPSDDYGAFSVSALIGLVTLTYDLSTSKWDHGSPVSWASFLPIFSFLRPSIYDLESGTGETDRETTAINTKCPLWGRG